MKQEEGTAIILHVTPFQDYDAVIDVLTEQGGRLSVVARGVRKHASKNKGHVRVGSMVRYEIFLSKSDGLGKLKKLDTLHALLSEDIKEQTRVLLLCEIIRSCIPESHSASFLFPLWTRLLNHKKTSEHYFYWIFIQILHYEGFLPFFQTIPRQDYAFVHENGELFSVSPAGELCKKVDVRILKVIKFFQQVGGENTEVLSLLQLCDSDRFELWEVLWWIYARHSEFFPRSKKIYESIDN